MLAVLECPPVDRLQQLALGLLGEADADALTSHVLECSRCGATLAGLRGSDTLADALNEAGHATATIPRGPAVDRAIEQACRLAGLQLDVSADDTASALTPDTGTSAAANSPSSAPPGEAEVEPPPFVLDLGDILSPPQAPGELGRLGPYRVLSLLGSGGMGMVFLAEDVQLQRRVALKAMKPSLATAADARQRFLREARAAAALHHDNIVTIYHVGEDRGVLWLAMELLEGESLDSRLKREEQLPIADAIQIGREIAEALAAAHRRGLIHRDIKPANVWLEHRESGIRNREWAASESDPPTPDPRSPTPSRVKVLDFGLARVETDDTHLTQTGLVIGTPAYMAPEQARGLPVDPRCDLFSLGCVLYRLLTGHMPFRGNDTLATLLSLATHTPPLVSTLVRDVPPALDDLVAKLLAKDPAHRPQTAAEVAATLAAIEGESRQLLPLPLGEGRGEGLPIRVTPKQPTSKSRHPLSPSPPLPLPRFLLRHRLAASLALLLLGCVALAGILMRIATPIGTIVLEIDQPEIIGAEVSVDGQQKLTIKTKDSQEPIQVVADEKKHTLKVTKGGFETFTQEFTVKAGKSEAVRVWLEPTPRVAVGGAADHGGSTSSNRGSLRDPQPPVDKQPAAAGAPRDHALHFGDSGEELEFPTLRFPSRGPWTVEGWVTLRAPIYNIGGSSSAVFHVSDATLVVKHQGLEGIKWSAGGPAKKLLPLVYSDENVKVNQRAHVALTCGPEGISFYLNGVLQDQPLQLHVSNEETTLHVCKPDPVWHKAAFHGDIDEIRVSTIARYRETFTPQPRFGPDKDTLALYHFDEGTGDVLNDSSGNGHHGKIVGPKWVHADGSPIAGAPSPAVASFDAAAPANYALSFDGNGAFVEIPCAIQTARSLTVETWVKFASSASDRVVAPVLTADLQPTSLSLYLAPTFAPDDRKLRTTGLASGEGWTTWSAQPAVLEEWLHIAAVWNGGRLHLFVNGKSQNQGFFKASEPGAPGQKILLGTTNSSAITGKRPQQFLHGALDEVRVSNVAHYGQDFTPPTRFEPDADTLALYHFDDGQGDVLTDSSGNRHHGKIVNAKWVPGIAGGPP